MTTYLLDMRVAARKAVAFSTDLTYQEFARSDLHQNAILKVLEIVGEAASRSDDFKTAHTFHGVRSLDFGTESFTAILRLISVLSGKLQDATGDDLSTSPWCLPE